MKKIMLVGETFSGKSSLIQQLSGQRYRPNRAMAVDYYGQFITTPGEFLENRRFYHALITTSADCDILALIQDATRASSLFPPLFGSMFNRQLIGIITKSDSDDANIRRAQIFLNNAGVKDIIVTSCVTKEGLGSLRRLLS
ncbi:EutP/PduV family microcompartment system protein [Desulfosediminicola ganghwensis]|uniref:EutP/PduV family microcompartment system protein n=1 Tax=Desulfosediminicola ganghwensis TaxID=2569540 RepID=UPI0010AD67D1|nr:EutP/PduV family microcompartment system protein [Desulfosediminicola ganghwensis]